MFRSDPFDEGLAARAVRRAPPQTRGSLLASGTRAHRRRNLFKASFAALALLVDAGAIMLASVASIYIYGRFAYGFADFSNANLLLGVSATLVFVSAEAARNGYSVSRFCELSGHAQQIFRQWLVAYLAATAIAFLLRFIDDTSRGVFLAMFAAGLCALFAGRTAMVFFAQRHANSGGVLANRILIVGLKDELDRFRAIHAFDSEGGTVVAERVLDDNPGRFGDDLEAAVAAARKVLPDEIYIVVPWVRIEYVDACVTAFMRTPATLRLHYDPDSPLGRFVGDGPDSGTARSSLRLHGYSIGLVGSLLKRAFDFCAALVALIVLFPIFIMVALAIKFETSGSVFFLQQRHGFNKRPFRIVKFRTMTSAEDGPAVRQATAGDLRVTRVGAFLRRTNLDELPQLINVLRGEMSLVGPRPHALVHDDQFGAEIALYARRHNVRPGITGWAQVNGLRGLINAPDQIRERVRHDLHYIDNWSFVFDIWILFLTVFSRRAYQNAL